MFSSPITRRAMTSQGHTQSFDLTAALRYMNDKTVKHINALLPNLGLRRFESRICTLTQNPFPHVYAGDQQHIGIDISAELIFQFFCKFLEKKEIKYNIIRHEDQKALDKEIIIQTIVFMKSDLQAKLSPDDFLELIEGFDQVIQQIQPVITSLLAHPEQFDLNKAITIINDHIKEFWYMLGVDVKNNECTSIIDTEAGAPKELGFRNKTAIETFKQFLTASGVSYQEHRAHIIITQEAIDKALNASHLVKLSEMFDGVFDEYMSQYKRESGMFKLC